LLVPLRCATQKVPQNAALAVKRNVDGKLQWKKWTYGQYQEEVTAAAKGLIALGLEPYHSVRRSLPHQPFTPM